VKPIFLFSRHPRLDREWPFLADRLRVRLGELGAVREVEAGRDEPLHTVAALEEVWGIAWFGGRVTAECIAAAPRLRALGGMTDNSGWGLPWAAMTGRDICFIDATRGWG
jgi:hypothetical protein